jgi:hypothetical protein
MRTIQLPVTPEAISVRDFYAAHIAAAFAQRTHQVPEKNSDDVFVFVDAPLEARDRPRES